MACQTVWVAGSFARLLCIRNQEPIRSNGQPVQAVNRDSTPVPSDHAGKRAIRRENDKELLCILRKPHYSSIKPDGLARRIVCPLTRFLWIAGYFVTSATRNGYPRVADCEANHPASNGQSVFWLLCPIHQVNIARRANFKHAK